MGFFTSDLKFDDIKFINKRLDIQEKRIEELEDKIYMIEKNPAYPIGYEAGPLIVVSHVLDKFSFGGPLSRNLKYEIYNKNTKTKREYTLDQAEELIQKHKQ